MTRMTHNGSRGYGTPDGRFIRPGCLRSGYLGPLGASSFLIEGLSYRTTFNKELWISSRPLYLI
jgi:hypothetical protein